jgi:hypothetical protein
MIRKGLGWSHFLLLIELFPIKKIISFTKSFAAKIHQGVGFFYQRGMFIMW